MEGEVVEEVLETVSGVPLWHVPIFLIGFPISRLRRYGAGAVLRDGRKVVVRMRDGVIEVMVPDNVKAARPEAPLLPP